MSPTVAELAVGLVAAALVFRFAVRAVPPMIWQLIDYINRSMDDDSIERSDDDYDR